MGKFINKPFDLILKRRSTRSFSKKPLDPADLEKFNIFLKGINRSNFPFLKVINGTIPLRLINLYSAKTGRIDSFKTFKNSYNILFGMVPKNNLAFVGYGYALELAVLKAAEFGIKSCWLGYFKHNLLEKYIDTPGLVIPAILALGYPQKQTLRDNFVQFAAGSTKRREWEELFFQNSWNQPLSKDKNHPLFIPLECLRLAPSSGNTQPWRILFDRSNQIIHFFKKPINKAYEKRGLHDIDLGIAVSHFDLGLKKTSLKGVWRVFHRSDLAISGFEYTISVQLT